MAQVQIYSHGLLLSPTCDYGCDLQVYKDQTVVIEKTEPKKNAKILKTFEKRKILFKNLFLLSLEFVENKVRYEVSQGGQKVLNRSWTPFTENI